MTDEQPGIAQIKFAFLLGAGASKESDIPAMVEFTDCFINELKTHHEQYVDLVKKIFELIKTETRPDLEDLMIALEILSKRTPYEKLLDHIRPLSPAAEKISIESDKLRLILQKYIANKTFVNNVSQIQFLEGLLEIFNDHGYIPIFRECATIK